MDGTEDTNTFKSEKEKVRFEQEIATANTVQNIFAEQRRMLISVSGFYTRLVSVMRLVGEFYDLRRSRACSHW